MTASPGWVEVDTGAIAHNLQVVRAHLGERVALCAVLKGDAYGHGIDLVAPAIVASGVGIAGITANDEAQVLRASGFTGRILRLRCGLAEEVADGMDHGIEEWVGGHPHAHVVQDAAVRRGRRLRVHVSLNSTGLSRDGIEVGRTEGRRALRAIGRMPGLDVVGVSGHFPCEDVGDVAEGTRRFERESRAAAAMLGRPTATRHCATTFAALSVPASRFDLVRIGAALYGDSRLAGGRLRPAMRAVSRIAAINPYSAGGTAGYDRAHRIAADARLAVVPIGYADGYGRVLGQRAEVLVRGRRARVVDRLAMNTFLIDVSQVDGVHVGDEVVLYGVQDGDAITAAEVERVTGQIAADLYTNWGRSLPRRAVAAGRAAAVRG
jgi:alanine racemase